MLGAGISFITVVLMILFPHASPEFIGRNSAFNSMIFMATNGGFKQLGAILLAAVPLLTGLHASGNLLILIATGMLVVTVYAASRKFIFRDIVND